MRQLKKQRFAAGPVIWLVLLLSNLCGDQAQGALNIIKPVQGGKIVYGQVDDQTTEAGAMGSLLRSLHNDYGERPQVGKLFQVRNSQSVAAFFSIAKPNQEEGRLAGIIIAIKVGTDHVEAAVVSDDASHFPSRLNSLMTTLFGVWHPFASVSAAAGGSSSPDTSLKQFVLPDRSASVSLPDGWQVRPKMSGGGTIYAGGPNGEQAALGMAIQVWDPRNRRVAQILSREQQGGQGNPQDAQSLFYPYGGEPATTFTNLMQMRRHKSGLAPAAFQITSSTALPERPPRRSVHLMGQVDFQDGSGPRELNVIYIDTPPVAKGCWWFEADVITVPVTMAEKERATLAAMLQSFRVNQAVINEEGAKLAQPEIDRIHAIGDAAKAQADAAHERNDIQNSSVYQHWDDIDRRSQSFSNYQLGYSVIQDN